MKKDALLNAFLQDGLKNQNHSSKLNKMKCQPLDSGQLVCIKGGGDGDPPAIPVIN